MEITQAQRADQFTQLHQSGKPLILYNIWDAGSAQAVQQAGAQALATGSWSVAESQGFRDGQQLPLATLLNTVKQIVGQVQLPLSVDFEGAYAQDPEGVANNASLLMDSGAIGINFEDQIVGATGLYSIDVQSARIAAIRAKAQQRGFAFFINSRTDLFLKTSDASLHAALFDEAFARAQAYHAAGASGFFAPGLKDLALIKALCDRCNESLNRFPVNVMSGAGAAPNAQLAAAGVSRISYGPNPYRAAMANLKDAAASVFLGH
jgi:2-methylisocitrate lyase-like PEP mutase family enzyme